MATLESIQAKIAKLQAQAEEVISKKSSAVLQKIRDLMEKHGITTADIEAHVGRRRGRMPGAKTATKAADVVVKYRDPKSGATWSGRGRAPSWIASAKDRNRFLVDESTAISSLDSAKPAKAGKYVRGHQPALYRDPKTGATWSGRGRAPAWLAGAKDRSRFLIAEVEGTAGKPKAAATKKAAPAKKAAAKKVAPKKPTSAATKSQGASKRAPAKKVAAKKVTANRASTKETVNTVAPSEAPVPAAQAVVTSAPV
ncbi:H-NS family nucleoid-associated regulatory protein [Burkholderia sp. Ax-1719]|uniref:H-NS family nucleoid-associated regulatory protein n=1 Tax=Burkholderia sp. Ax-1719 TaxID=2608334 RepID=UPI0014214D65|nr:H-NS family nucleoid-associated regulatory protein [Burkholderia sp. Ax-1719]NIE66851.1 H-NS histone family protein [Burkholderia sp. Ax-1719]